jgi:threonine dehydratase
MKLWEEVETAQSKIQKIILRTPMIYSDTFSKLTGREVFLKLENLQKTGSFKIRGAYYKLSQLTPSMKKGEWWLPLQETMPRELHWLHPS